MNEFNEPTVLPPFGELFADSAPTDDALQRMLDIAVDPATPDPGDSLVPDSQDVALDDFDEHVSLDDSEVPDHGDYDNPNNNDPLLDESEDPFASSPVPDTPVDYGDDYSDQFPQDPAGGAAEELPDDPLADF